MARSVGCATQRAQSPASSRTQAAGQVPGSVLPFCLHLLAASLCCCSWGWGSCRTDAPRQRFWEVTAVCAWVHVVSKIWLLVVWLLSPFTSFTLWRAQMEILKKTDDEGILCYYSTSVFGLTLTACRQEGMGLRAQHCNSPHFHFHCHCSHREFPLCPVSWCAILHFLDLHVADETSHVYPKMHFNKF